MSPDAANAFDGLRLAGSFRPEVAFLDIGMPVMDGCELARRLRASPGLGDVLLVAVSGWGGEADKRKAVEAGFDLHLTKPVSADDVQAAMRRLRDAAATG